MVKKEEITPEYLSENPAIWPLIEMRQYDQIAKFLEEILSISSPATGQATLNILSTAQLICWVCRQCQIEIEQHRQALEEAVRRKNELNQQLYVMLNQINSTIPFQINLVQPALIISATDESKTQQEKTLFSLSVHCLGTFRVYQNGQLITDWKSLKARSIFKYLVAHYQTPIPNEVLMDVFWPDTEPAAARRNLHQAIYNLRQTLKQGCSKFQLIQFENDCYRLNPELSIWIDFVELEKHVKAGQCLEEAGQFIKAEIEYNLAEKLYQGEFLEEDLYEDWPVWQREYLRRVYSDLIDRLTRYYVERAEYTLAIRLCQKILARDNCHEEMHRRLMECYLVQGQRGLAVRQYQAYVQALRIELDIPPSPEIQSFYQKILNGTGFLA
jgi:DNA-binding SARP family transcriptional activator